MSERPVTTDALETLGKIHEREEHRDAIHLAVEPVTAGIRLYPGQHIGVVEGVASPTGKLLGIVDPFLTAPVEPGQKFWFVMYPRMVTSLRHVWAHPDFPDGVASAPSVTPAVIVSPVRAGSPRRPKKESPKLDQDKLIDASANWIHALADRVDITYNRLMEGAADWVDAQERGVWGSYIIGGAEMEGESVPPEFWNHYEVVTGKKVPVEHRGSFFSCSC